MIRALRWGVLGLGLLLLAVYLVAWTPLRQTAFERIARTVEASNGVRLAADDLTLAPLRGFLELEGLQASVPDAEPFLTVRSARVEVRWGSLFGDRIVLPLLRIDSPNLNLGAPLPESSESSEEGQGSGVGLDIERIEVIDAQVDSGAMPDTVEMWLDRFRVAGAEVRGSLLAEILTAELAPTQIEVASSRRPLIAARAAAEVRADLVAEGFELKRLSVEGDALELSAQGSRSTGDGPIEIEYQLAADPAELFPDLTHEGELTSNGQLTRVDDRLVGDLEAVVQRLPAELLGPAFGLASEDLAAIDLTDTVLDLRADVEVELALAEGAQALDQLKGEITVDWQAPEERRLALSARALPNGALLDETIGIAFTADLLPDAAGDRRVEGSLHAASWRELASGRLGPTRLDLEVADPVASARRLGLTLDPGESTPQGELRLAGNVSGPLDALALDLDAGWNLDDGPLLAASLASLSGVGMARPLHLAIEATLLPASDGLRQVTTELLADDPKALADNPARARLQDLTFELRTPDMGRMLDELRRGWQQALPRLALPEALAEGGLPSGLQAGAVELEGTGGGSLVAPRIVMAGDWRPAADERLRFDTTIEPASSKPFFTGEASLDVELAELDLARLSDGLKGRLSGTLKGAAVAAEAGVPSLQEDAPPQDPQEGGTAPLQEGAVGGTPFLALLERFEGRLELTGKALVAGGTELDDFDLALHMDDADVEISRLEGRLATGQELRGAGRLELGRSAGEATLRGGEIQFELPRPIAGLEQTIERVLADLRLDGGTLVTEIAFQHPDAPAKPVALARLPLGALRARPELAGIVDSLPTRADSGEPWIGLSGLELEPFLPLFELEEDAMRPGATLEGSITLDLAEPTASTGELTIRDLVLETEQSAVAAAESLRFALAGSRLELRPSRLLVSRQPERGLDASGRIDLLPGWQPADGFESLVTQIDLDVDGTFDTAALAPLLAGGLAEGEAALQLRIQGTPSTLAAEGRYNGTGSSLYFATPYSTRLEDPVAELVRRGGSTVLDSLRAQLNGGTLQASGVLLGPEGVTLKAAFEEVRYRLDYGLNTRSSGRVDLQLPTAERRGRLAGEIVLDRGTLSRDLDYDRSLRSLLFAPDLTSAEGTSLSETLDLDLSIITAEGVRVKNNLADLRADWGRIRVRGTLENPLISGKIEVDPGGKVTAYGQAVRIDEASIELAGDPIVAPRMILKTTSSFDDPTVRGNRRGLSQVNLGDDGPGAGGFWEQERSDDVSASSEITGGLMSYYSEQFAGALAGGLERTELSLEPLPIFGETDTQARLTASYRVSPNVDLIYSVNPRDAEGQTYLLDLHNFDIAPSLTAQVFTNDENNEGLTLVQVLERGGGPELTKAPRLNELELATPEGVARRRLKRALELRKGDAFGEDEAFDIEIDVLDELRRQGYPGGEVRVTVEPAPRRRFDIASGERVDVAVAVETGPHVRFEFEGDVPARRSRRLIVQSYRTVDESTALAELERETVKALRGEGFLHPQVVATSEREDPSAGEGSRVVRIQSQGGRRIAPGPLVIEGVGLEEAAILAQQFTSRLMRVELAASVPGADLFLVRTMRTLGYPQARIAERELSEDGKQLTLRVEPGARNRIVEVQVEGVLPEDAEQLAALMPAREGAPARSDDVTRLAHAIEDHLQRRGFAEAEVRTVLEPIASDRPHDLVLRCLVEPGPPHRLGNLQVEGARATKDRWAQGIVGLDSGSVFRQQDLDEARRRLWRTGLFERVRTRITPREESIEVGTVSDVVFELDELPRYLFAYGGRWESGERVGLVLDAIDRNFLGRGTTLGIRALYSDVDDRSLRLYHVTPRVRGSSSSLEVFLEGKSEITEGLLVDGFESWAQLTFPLGPKTTQRVYVRHQDLSITDADEASTDPVSSEEPERQRLRIPSLGWQLSYDTRDQALGRRRADGMFVGLDFTFTDDSLGSDISAFGIFSQLKHFRSLLRDRDKAKQLTWAQSVRVGYLEPFENTLIPFVTRLRAGGEYSVRGYRTESLGPLDADGNALGGEVLFILNEELHFPVWGEQLSGLVFFDAGNVWQSFDDVDSELFTALGVGLRASTPAGPLRLDIALPLDRRDGIDDSVRFYLGFGNVF